MTILPMSGEAVIYNFSVVVVVDVGYVKPVVQIFAMLSMVGTGGVVASYIIWPGIRNTIRQLHLALTVADFFIASGNFVATFRYERLEIVNDEIVCEEKLYGCVAQSFITTTGFMVTYFYSVIVAIYFYMANSRRRAWRFRRNVKWAHLICWVIPLILAISAVSTGALGKGTAANTGPWCWISTCRFLNQRILPIVWMVICGHGWLIIACVAWPLVTLFMRMDVARRNREDMLHHVAITRSLEESQKLLFRPGDDNFRHTPIMLYFFRVWSIIRFILSAIEIRNETMIVMPDALGRFLVVMQCIGDNSQGLYNFILFCILDSEIRNHALAACCPSLVRPRTEARTLIQSN